MVGILLRNLVAGALDSTTTAPNSFFLCFSSPKVFFIIGVIGVGREGVGDQRGPGVLFHPDRGRDMSMTIRTSSVKIVHLGVDPSYPGLEASSVESVRYSL